MAAQAADAAKKDYERMLQREEEPELLITMPPGLQVRSWRASTHPESCMTRCDILTSYAMCRPVMKRGAAGLNC